MHLCGCCHAVPLRHRQKAAERLGKIRVSGKVRRPPDARPQKELRLREACLGELRRRRRERTG